MTFFIPLFILFLIRDLREGLAEFFVELGTLAMIVVGMAFAIESPSMLDLLFSIVESWVALVPLLGMACGPVKQIIPTGSSTDSKRKKGACIILYRY